MHKSFSSAFQRLFLHSTHLQSTANYPYLTPSRIMSSKGTVLISGINGFIAAHTAKLFLEAGYSVRGTARSLSSTKGLQQVLKPYIDNGSLSFVEVPDITVGGAFDTAVQGVHAIVHMASPVSLFFTEADPVIKAAREGTRSILASALNHAGPQLRTIVLTASIASVLGTKPPGALYTEDDWNPINADKLGPNPSGPYIYGASKTAAERAFWAFKEAFSPQFTMTAVHPAFVAGPPLVLPEDPETLNETTKPIYDILVGKDVDLYEGSFGLRASVDVRDVARMFLWAVEYAKVANGQRYLAASGQAGNGQAIADILRAYYPQRKGVIPEGTPGKGYVKGFEYDREQGLNFDNTKATRATGIKWIGYEEMILDSAKVFERYL